MSVRRGVTWLGAVGLLAGTTVSFAAAPAMAEGESVRVRAPSSISAGGSPASVTVNVSMRKGDCVNVRTALGVHLPGLTADRVELRVAANGNWRPVPVSDAGNGLVVAERTAPQKPELCARKSVSSRYRVQLAAGVPEGRVTLLVEAYTAGGRLLGRSSDSARMTGRTGQAPDAPERTPALVIPSATAQATEEPAPEATEEVAAALPTVPAAEESGGIGLGGWVMVVGLVMVGIGVALIVLLVRRSRAERARVAATSSGAEATARIVLLGAEPTTRIPPAAAQPTSGIVPGAGRPTARPGPAGTDPTVRIAPGGRPGGVPPADPPGGVPPAFGDQTLILPTSRVTPPRPAGTTPSGQPGPVPAQPVSPAGDGASAPGAAPPRPAGAVPPEQPPAGGPDATLILPPSRRPQQ